MTRRSNRSSARLAAACAGFTLMELLVAATLMSIVMASVYVAFGSTLRTWRSAETKHQTYQDARTAMHILSRELGSIIGGSEHLFQGKHDQIEFYTVSTPMNIDKSEGPCVLWVQYRLNRTGHTLVREEALVKGPLPLPKLNNKGEIEIEESRIKLGRKHKFEVVSDVRGFDIAYKWIPQVKRDPKEPPRWIEPIVMEESRRGWGLPQGVEISLTLEDKEAGADRSVFTTCTAFRGQTSFYDEKKMRSRGKV